MFSNLSYEIIITLIQKPEKDITENKQKIEQYH